MRNSDENGMRETMKQALAWASIEVDGIHLGIDMDVMDPSESPGVGTPRRGVDLAR